MTKVFEIMLPIVRESHSRSILSRWLARCRAAWQSVFQPMDEDSIPQPFDVLLLLAADEPYSPFLSRLLLESIHCSPSMIITTKPLPRGIAGWQTLVSTKYSKGVRASLKLLTTLKGNDLCLRIYARDPSPLLQTALLYSALPYS